MEVGYRIVQTGQRRQWRCGIGGLLVLAMLPAGALAQNLPPQTLPPAATPSVIGSGGERREGPVEPPPLRDEPLVGGQGLNGLPRITVRGGGSRFTLSGVDFDPSGLLAAEELDAVAGRYVGRSLGFEDLQEMVEAVNALYDAHGQAAARAVLPPQRIEGGRVRIQLVEGRLDGVAVLGDPAVGAAYVRNRVRAEPGAVLDTQALHRNVLRFNLTNDAQLRAALQPGPSFGLTNLELAVIEPPRASLDLSADNYGFEATGRGQGGVLFRTGSLFAAGDRVALYASGSRGTRIANIAYNLPVGTDGGRVGFSVSGSQTEIVQGEYRAYDITGASRAISLNGSHPLWTGDSTLVSVNGALTRSHASNNIADVYVTGTRANKASAGLSFYYGDAETSVLVSPLAELARLTETASGRQRVAPFFTGDASAIHRFAASWTVQARGSWQLSTVQGLPGSQLFQIGGATSLRALPPGVLTGDTGAYGQLELHWDASPLAKGLDLYGFYETGLVRLAGGNRVVMSDAGVGASLRLSERVSADMAVAARLRDGDGTPMDRYRLYVRTVFHVF